MARKKYSDYKADPTIKIPIVAWLFNRGALQLLYTGFAAFSVLAMVLLYSSGANAWKRITTEPQDVSPYQEIEALNSPGRDWAESFIAKSPADLSGWTVSDIVKPQNITAPDCAFNDNPSTSLLSTHTASSGEAQVRVLLYGAGQAGADFDKYVALLKECSNVEIIDEEFGRTAKFKNGFITTMGDVIVNFVGTDNTQRDKLHEFYYNELVSSLKEYSCLDLDVNSTDDTRSFFYNPDTYGGLKETTVVETQVDIKNVPTVSSLSVDEIQNPGTIMPEAPLPQDFPELPKEEVAKPSLPQAVEDKDDFKADAIYNIADTNGPGCGWAWSAQKAPVYDESKLMIDKNSAIVENQNNVDTKAQEYVNSKNDWALKTVLVMPSVNSWNKYSQDVNNVHDRWDWLNTERDKLYQPWHDYVREHNDWAGFDGRKSDALTKYNEKLQVCLDTQETYLEWEEKWGELYAQQQAGLTAPVSPPTTPEPTETPTDPENPSDSPTEAPKPTTQPTTPEKPIDVPEPPENCLTLPERPAIIDQEKPAEPMAPEIPAGVTIPDSWDKP